MHIQSLYQSSDIVDCKPASPNCFFTQKNVETVTNEVRSAITEKKESGIPWLIYEIGDRLSLPQAARVAKILGDQHFRVIHARNITYHLFHLTFPCLSRSHFNETIIRQKMDSYPIGTIKTCAWKNFNYSGDLYQRLALAGITFEIEGGEWKRTGSVLNWYAKVSFTKFAQPQLPNPEDRQQETSASLQKRAPQS